MYKPRPIKTDKVVLPAGMVGLIDRLAKNNHDLWAAHRIQNGWSYDREASIADKTHPNLVPFAQIPKSEQDLDRKLAVQTIKALLALGCQVILPPVKGKKR